MPQTNWKLQSTQHVSYSLTARLQQISTSSETISKASLSRFGVYPSPPLLFSLAVIHDSFGTLPSRTQNLFMYVRVAFMELYSQYDVLEDFRGQVLHQLDSDKIEELPSLPTKGNLDLTSVLRSQYCFA